MSESTWSHPTIGFWSSEAYLWMNKWFPNFWVNKMWIFQELGMYFQNSIFLIWIFFYLWKLAHYYKWKLKTRRIFVRFQGKVDFFRLLTRFWIKTHFLMKRRLVIFFLNHFQLKIKKQYNTTQFKDVPTPWTEKK